MAELPWKKRFHGMIADCAAEAESIMRATTLRGGFGPWHVWYVPATLDGAWGYFIVAGQDRPRDGAELLHPENLARVPYSALADRIYEWARHAPVIGRG